jgi:hypothetical protein
MTDRVKPQNLTEFLIVDVISKGQPGQAAMLRAIRQHFDHEGVCPVCVDVRTREPEPYPCPTLRALAEAFGVADPGSVSI